MLFNSIDFAFFLPIVFLLYWFVVNKTLSAQNLLIVASSYLFYGWWDYRFLFLLLFSTGLDYFTGLKIHNASNLKRKKTWFWLSVCVNLGLLMFFKYYNFFVESFVEAFSFMGYKLDAWTLQLVLPVGISFYTFHGLSYVIDIYNERSKPTRSFLEYAGFVSFFPLLVAGPIERAGSLLPQFGKKRIFDYERATDGLRQIIYGLFKKIVVADTCAVYVNDIFNHYTEYSGSTLVIGALLFSVQIYGDFSGYSDIALGVARLFGFELKKNFAFPYFSRDIAEFWRRWHISLSSWFRDYVYIPLGGSKVNKIKVIRNTFIIFILSGFWHGANWTFVFWGLLNAMYFLPIFLLKQNRANLDVVAVNKTFPGLKEFAQIALTFSLTTLAWIFFRSETLSGAFVYLKQIFSASLFHRPQVFPVYVFLIIAIFVVVEWMGRRNEYAFYNFGLTAPTPLRWSVYYVMLFFIFYFSTGSQQFIYFQF